jgi:hypothetical protein
VQLLVQGFRHIVFDRPEQGAVHIILVPRLIEVLGNEALRHERNRNVARFVALAVHPKVQNPLALVQIADAQRAELFPAQAMVKKRCENGPVAFAFEGFG